MLLHFIFYLLSRVEFIELNDSSVHGINYDTLSLDLISEAIEQESDSTEGELVDDIKDAEKDVTDLIEEQDESNSSVNDESDILDSDEVVSALISVVDDIVRTGNNTVAQDFTADLQENTSFF